LAPITSTVTKSIFNPQSDDLRAPIQHLRIRDMFGEWACKQVWPRP
jgi:hypothetical protein